MSKKPGSDCCERRYRWEVVRPVMLAYDRRTYVRAAERLLPALGVPFSRFVPTPERLPLDRGQSERSVQCRRNYRLWAFTRMTGRWPHPVVGMRECPMILPQCSACGKRQVSVCHALCVCEGTEGMYREGFGSSKRRQNTPAFITSLFRRDTMQHEEAIRFVGVALLRCMDTRSVCSDVMERRAADAGMYGEYSNHDYDSEFSEYSVF